jgi:sigma-B regulation protein RsbU (phosphoserine phosphatase)
MVRTWWRDLSFQAKLAASVCTLVVATGAAITLLAFRSARSSTTTLADSLFREVSGHAVTHTQAYVFRAQPVVLSLRELADRGLALDEPDRLSEQLIAFMEANPGLSWGSYSSASGRFVGVQRTAEGKLRINQSHIEAGQTRMQEHDVLADGSRRLFREDQDSGYDPRTRPFYLAAQEVRDEVVWLPPYVFFDQGVPGISCATPVRDRAGALRGVLSVDFDLNALSEFVSQLEITENSRVFLFTQDHVLLAFPGRQVASQSGGKAAGELLSLADIDDDVAQAYAAALDEKELKAARGSEFTRCDFRHAGRDYFASATAFPVGNDQVWVVGALAPEADFLGDVQRSQWMALGAALIGLLAALVVAVVLARRVSQPVQALIGFMRRVGGGDLEAQADFQGGREFRELSIALNQMIEDLRDRLRLRHSLDLAMDVQQRLLPQKLPDVQGLEIAGQSTYCDETGGDYYDFLVLDAASPSSVLVAIGDVMGHGVAAALVMAAARAVLRDRAHAEGGLAELMSRLNRLLASDLEGTRFMTMHLSVVDAERKSFRWVSAGHDPAIVYDRAGDKFEVIDGAELPLGILDYTEYREYAFSPLVAGHVIVIGTDGVWEMPNDEGALYGKDRLQEMIRSSAALSAHDIAQAIERDLSAFQGKCRAVDDVTFVVIKVL